MNFEDFSFDPRISAGIRAAGYTTPTPIQQQAIPVVLQGRDVLGTAQTGTGKTAAFVLPILQRLTKGPLRHVRALIVAPTRELAEQIHQASVDLGRKTRVRSVTVYGGVSKNRQVEALRRGAEIVVACPGRLLDLASDRSIDLSHVEVSGPGRSRSHVRYGLLARYSPHSQALAGATPDALLFGHDAARISANWPTAFSTTRSPCRSA